MSPHCRPTSPAASLFAAIAACALLSCPLSAGDLPTYRVEVIAGSLQGFNMNERGDVVGRQLDAQQIGRAFVAPMGGTVEVLPLPSPWLSSDAYAISNHGVIVGAVSDISIASIGSRAAAWYPVNGTYQFVLLGALTGHNYSTATDVNDHGDIVGGSGGIGLGLYSAAVLFASGGPTLLPELSLPAGVNNNRVVAASNVLLDLDDLTVTSVPLPAGTWQGMACADINNVNGICGYIAGYSGCSTFPVIAMPGSPMQVIGGCATTTSAVSLNDQGDALTYVYNGGLGCVFAGVGYTNIGSLIAPSEGSWAITGVSTINNARQMLVAGRTPQDTSSRLLRLTPIIYADLNQDGRVDGADLGMLLAAWASADPAADLNHNGSVGGEDLGLLLAAWSS